jgi:hypothetical protein
MSEEEIALFSEFLEQKEYARGNVAGMNPNMVRRKVVNGRTVTKVSKSTGGKSAKQAIRSRAEKEVAANAPKPEYKSEGFRTVETERSKAARKDYQERSQRMINDKTRNIRQDLRSSKGLRYGYNEFEIAPSYYTGDIHKIINQKEHLVNVGRYQREKGWGHIVSNGNRDHDMNLSTLVSGSAHFKDRQRPLKLRNLYDTEGGSYYHPRKIRQEYQEAKKKRLQKS